MISNANRGRMGLGLIVLVHLIFVVSCTTTGSTKRMDQKIKRIAKRGSKVANRGLPPGVVDKSPFAHAILLNGGQQPKANFFSHVVHLREMRKVLRMRQMRDERISIFASDGAAPGRDLMIVSTLSPQFKLLFRHSFERAFFEPVPKLINTVIAGKSLLPSKRWELEQFISKLAKQLPEPGQSAPGTPLQVNQRPVFLFVTDHGTRNRSWRNHRNQKISLWHESLNVEQFSQMLRPMRQRRMVYVMSQCFSGSFVWSVFPRSGILEAPDGNRCGFFSTSAKRYAYGCYAQTQREEDVGHAHRFIAAMAGASTLVDAHERVMLSDKTPDVPMRSSDGYLRALLTVAAQRKRQTLSAFASAILAKYGPQSGQLLDREQRLIDAMAKRFLLARPRHVGEIAGRIKQLAKRGRFRRGLNRTWKSAYRSLRNDYLRQFYKLSPGMRGRLKNKWKRLMRDVGSQSALQQDPDVALLRKGFLAFLKKQPGVLKRLKRLQGHLLGSERLHFWTEVQTAVLMRMEVLYYRMAGRLFLLHGKGGLNRMHQRGLQRLLACEQTSLGIPPPGTTPKKLKPLRYDRSASIPSLLGIQFRLFRHRIAKGISKGTVQVKAVGVKTPAERAGLRRGDLIVGANGAAFKAHYDLREQIMLHPAKRPFVLHVLRGGKMRKMPVQLAPMKTPNFLKYRNLKGTKLPALAKLGVLTPQGALPSPKQDTVLFFFWATWCGPCKLALPILRQWHKKYPQLKIVASSTEKRTIVEKWYAGHPKAMPFLRVHDPFGQFAVKMLIFSFPTFVVARQGKVVYIHKGAHKFGLLERELQKALK